MKQAQTGYDKCSELLKHILLKFVEVSFRCAVDEMWGQDKENKKKWSAGRGQEEEAPAVVCEVGKGGRGA